MMDRSAILGAFEALFRGTIPGDIPGNEVSPGDEPLAQAINQLFTFMREIRDFIVPLAKGELSQRPPEVRNFMASPFKELHSRLSQLTWQAEQVAKGDFSQRVDFMGDFSVAFNTMVIALEAKERALNETIQRLGEEEQRYRLLFEEEQDAVVIYDIGSGHFFNVNRTAVERYGYTQEQFLSLSLADIFHGRALEMPRMWEEVHPGEPRLFELENWRKDGSCFPVEISVGAFSYGGKSFVCLIIRDISERKRIEAELFQLATTDVLTGLANRRHFLDLAQQETWRSKRYHRPLSLLMLDIDFFKRVNDTHGHGGGDQALVAFAEVCLTTLRKIDLMGRLGGEEFAILLPETSLEAGREIGERLRRSVEACTILSEGARFGITVSLGLAELNPGDESFDALLKRADGALYEAKHQGRNRLVHSG